MNKLFFKSTSADLQKFNQSLQEQLIVINKNILYCTNQLDFIRKKILEQEHNKALQTQVDDYFKEDEQD